MKRVYRDERGSSLVMTIIAMAFISILAATVIAMTVTNIRLKQSQKKSQENFYNADSIVDAIRAGLYDLAAESAEEAYEDAIVLYGSSNTSMKQVYTKKFMTNMIKNLSKGTSSYPAASGDRYYYSDEVIRRFLTDVQSGNGAILADGYQSAQSDRGGYGYMDADLDSLILRDIKVMKTDKDYQTMIKTDIRVNVPNIMEETDSEYLAYALIADNQILSENDLGGGWNTVNGSVYAGIAKSNITGASRPESGIIVSRGSKLKLTSDYVITRGDIRLDGNGTLDINTGLDKDSGVYAENIETKQEKVKGKNTLTIAGNSYIADDMELWGNDDSVTITGNYYGYNYREDYSSPSSPASKQSEYSSAILINSKNATLNLEDVKNLMLAGYTFISKGLNKYQNSNLNPHDDEELSSGHNQDIAMGESMTLKSTQLAYYVPNDFVKDGHNDASKWQFTNSEGDEYTFDLAGYMSYLNCPIANLDLKRDYLDNTVPLTCYYRNDLNVKGNLKYFYLNFISDKEAKAFYKVFQQCDPYKDVKGANEHMLSNYGLHLNVNVDPVNGTATERAGAVLTRSGNILCTDASSGKEQYILEANQDTNDPLLYNDARDLSKRYMSYQMSLMKNYDLVQTSSQFRLDLRKPEDISTDPANALRKATFTKCGDAFPNNTPVNNPTPNDPDHVLKTNLFSTLVKENLLDAYTGPAVQEITVKMKDGTERTAVVVIATGNYTWDGSGVSSGVNSGLILARGNVTLKSSFNGLIIAGEDISFGDTSITVGSDRKLLQAMFNADKELGSAAKFYHLFSKYFQTTINSTIGNGEHDRDTVEYENWKKNKENN